MKHLLGYPIKPVIFTKRYWCCFQGESLQCTYNLCRLHEWLSNVSTQWSFKLALMAPTSEDHGETRMSSEYCSERRRAWRHARVQHQHHRAVVHHICNTGEKKWSQRFQRGKSKCSNHEFAPYYKSSAHQNKGHFRLRRSKSWRNKLDASTCGIWVTGVQSNSKRQLKTFSSHIISMSHRSQESTNYLCSFLVHKLV